MIIKQDPDFKKTLAIIGKTADECKAIKNQLHHLQVDLEILTGEEANYIQEEQ